MHIHFQLAQQCIQISTRINYLQVYIRTSFVCSTLHVILQGFVDPIMQQKGHREMPTDNTGVQTRAMAQRTDSEPLETQNQNVNPTVELYKSKDESIKDFVRKHGIIALDWYVPNFLKHQSR